MKQFGIRITLSSSDTMRASHLLGEDWESYRWYRTVEERDKAFEELQQPLPYYQRADNSNLILTKVENNHSVE
ncbi:hypothetical protein [Nitrosococcus oceani]|uniref:Uncharacterized protein n=1 Tax=Nitrosococcus oceani C-27 TaxID=314279 RepID=A0A0E2Z448_9GAMM|nr:hypothetical protein [Nitrosococcus oceani]EDZ68455.1 hypothetical protein NOC27_1782 [Nitrosococcus oceani AFC27]KFI19996.1 hypothetical protein IB75_05070 [Nitrosococcus oceani C-27]KFI23253.1 hypothetical protein HW44_04940 [Nitrosococcus oceani]GEM20713.1 hypothetical protein NONS58_21330 [Nitrosococcus oceani]